MSVRWAEPREFQAVRDITRTGSPARLCTSSMLPAKDSNWSQFRARMSLPVARSWVSSAVRSPTAPTESRQATARLVPTLIITLVW
ncbi:hypothetical protein D3C80_2078340 [compost metagenome]